MPLDALPIPDVPEDITPDWMTAALASSCPGVEVSGLEVLDQHSGTTGRVQLRIAYAPGATGPDTVYVKLPPFSASQRRLVDSTDMGRTEARFYAELAAETPVRVPYPYYANYGDDPSAYVMVLEDLTASASCTLSSLFEPHSDTHGRQTIEALARLHAHFWNDDRFDTSLSWVRRAMRGSFGARLVDSAREQFGAERPPVFTELCQLYVERHEAITEIFDEGEQTLVHGDTHAGNHFIEGDDVGLYDWAVISRSPGIRDIAIYLGNSCPTDVRREHQEEWLRGYRAVLVENGVDAPSYEDLWDLLRLHLLYAWMSATTTLAMGAKWQDVDVARIATERATLACADLETVEAVRARL
jgi:aminoglycoside phosphotransferase (APT) family kinase protein